MVRFSERKRRLREKETHPERTYQIKNREKKELLLTFEDGASVVGCPEEVQRDDAVDTRAHKLGDTRVRGRHAHKLR